MALKTLTRLRHSLLLMLALIVTSGLGRLAPPPQAVRADTCQTLLRKGSWEGTSFANMETVVQGRSAC